MTWHCAEITILGILLYILPSMVRLDLKHCMIYVYCEKFSDLFQVTFGT